MRPEQIAAVDQKITEWRQGDVVLGDVLPFIHLANLESPGTQESSRLKAEGGGAGLAVVATEGVGFVVTSQTCDVVRRCAERPYVEVCPLVELPEDEAALVQQGRRTQFSSLPGLGEPLLAADLDRSMTIEKAALVDFQSSRQPGVTSEAEARAFAEALARKRNRAALPDDFTQAAGRLRDRVVQKHSRDSNEGRFLRSVREIRVRAEPSWSAETVIVEFLFVFARASSIPPDADTWVEALLDRFAVGGRYVEVSGRAVGLDQLSAATFVETDRLELDHLSARAQ